MSIAILTPYKLFFITQDDILYALMKDGRVLKIKQTPYFSNISSDRKTIAGISFDGENTHILSLPFGFDLAEKKEITSLFGYFYYPCLSSNGKKMAVIEADLLKPRPQGELRIYTKKIKRWYMQECFESKMKPAFLSKQDDSLFFVDTDENLIKTVAGKQEILAQNVQNFTLSPAQTKIAYFDGTYIFIYSLLEHRLITSFPVINVTALCFDLSENEILYATAQESRYGIYAQNYLQSKTVLLTQTDSQIIFLSA